MKKARLVCALQYTNFCPQGCKPLRFDTCVRSRNRLTRSRAGHSSDGTQHLRLGYKYSSRKQNQKRHRDRYVRQHSKSRNKTGPRKLSYLNADSSFSSVLPVTGGLTNQGDSHRLPAVDASCLVVTSLERAQEGRHMTSRAPFKSWCACMVKPSVRHMVQN